MIINATTGGAGLNFNVVGGTAQPTSPKENTVWVNTGTGISSWVFSATQPSSPSAGMVWFQAGTSAPASFNALKKNNITVYPNGCKQYVSGAWVSKTAKTYQSGAWAEWIVYLIKNGDCANVTGGWTAKHTANGGKIELDSSGLYWENPWTQDGAYTTVSHNTAIDFSGFKSLSFYISYLDGTSFDKLKARIKSTDGTYLAELDFKNGLNKWHSIDLSAVKSKGFVEFYTGAYIKVRVSEAYLS